MRDLDKMEAVAEIDGFDMENFTPMHCELNSFESVREAWRGVCCVVGGGGGGGLVALFSHSFTTASP